MKKLFSLSLAVLMLMNVNAGDNFFSGEKEESYGDIYRKLAKQIRKGDGHLNMKAVELLCQQEMAKQKAYKNNRSGTGTRRARAEKNKEHLKFQVG